jgi:hypothetical protein
MNRRGILTTVTVCVLATVVAWVLFPVRAAKTDTAKYERWKQTSHLFGRVMWCERHLPRNLVSLFHLSTLDQKYIDEHERLGEALVASGFLTNVTIAVAAAPTNATQFAQVANRLRKAFPGRNEWEFWVRSNAVVVTCQPQNVLLCRQALQE